MCAKKVQYGLVLDFVLMTCAAFTGDFANASALFNSLMGTIGESILALADLFGFGDWLRESWQGAMDFLDGINLFESGARILTGLWDGLESIFQAVMGCSRACKGQIASQNDRQARTLAHGPQLGLRPKTLLYQQLKCGSPVWPGKPLDFSRGIH